MGSEETHRVRLVRCPKCRMLLPEPTNVVVYKCGECDTILQVKNRKNDVKGTSSLSRETRPAQTNELNSVSVNKNSSTSLQEAVLPSSGECSSTGDDGTGKKISSDCQGEQLKGVNSSSEKQKNEGDDNVSQDRSIEKLQVSNQLNLTTAVNSETGNEHGHNESQDQSNEQLPVSKQLSLTTGVDSEAENGCNHSESQDYDVEQLQTSYQLKSTPEVDSEVDLNNEGDSTFRSSNADKVVAKVENSSTVSPSRLAGEYASSEIITSSPDDHRQQSNTSFARHFGRMTSVDNFETPVFSPSSELSSVREYMPKSPTTRSAHAYYDGSVSSYDGFEDQLFQQDASPYKIPIKRDKFLMTSDYELHQARNLSAAYSDTRHYSTNHRVKREFHSRLTSSHPRDYYPVGYESGSTSTQLYNDFPQRSTDMEKVKLMRIVHELQDQLNKTSYLNATGNQVPIGVTGKKKYYPPYYSGEIPEEEISLDLNHHRYSAKSRSNWSGKYRGPQIPFSGEVPNSRRHTESCLCRHCSPQDWQYSAPLPPPVPLHNSRGFSRLDHNYSYYNPYSSCPTSPQQITDSELLRWRHDAYSDDQMHKEHYRKTTQHIKERNQQLKRHLRPAAGGAPFVTCYRCLAPLQLPADFLLFRKKSHQLRCGACSKVLKFSLENKTHIAPYANAVIHPPSNPVNNPVNGRNLDSVSLSDDYGLSHSRSISIDAEPLFLAPFRRTLGRSNARDSSYDSSDSKKERKQFSREQPRNKHKYPAERHQNPGTSSNISRLRNESPENKEPPKRSASPLHRLMGYSSPSLVIRGSDPSSSPLNTKEA